MVRTSSITMVRTAKSLMFYACFSVLLLDGRVCASGIVIKPRECRISFIVGYRPKFVAIVMHPRSTSSLRRQVAPPQNVNCKIQSRFGVLARQRRHGEMWYGIVAMSHANYFGSDRWNGGRAYRSPEPSKFGQFVQTPTGALPLDPVGRLPSPDPLVCTQ